MLNLPVEDFCSDPIRTLRSEEDFLLLVTGATLFIVLTRHLPRLVGFLRRMSMRVMGVVGVTVMMVRVVVSLPMLTIAATPAIVAREE